MIWPISHPIFLPQLLHEYRLHEYRLHLFRSSTHLTDCSAARCTVLAQGGLVAPTIPIGSSPVALADGVWGGYVPTSSLAYRFQRNILEWQHTRSRNLVANGANNSNIK
jgi:hypothetical protein